MNGDFTRDTFHPEKHYTRVLMQQGRVQLDADWNEQAAILLHYLQTLAADLIGPFGGPELSPSGSPAEGFSITGERQENQPLDDLIIGEGHYYVDGILCENRMWTDSYGQPHRVTYYNQPDYRVDPRNHPLPRDGNFLVYLDVWERLVTSYEDSGLREVALGGPDTAVRSKVVWQVKFAENLPNGGPIGGNRSDWKDWLTDLWKGNGWTHTNNWQPRNRGRLQARAREDSTLNPDACAIPPGARYRGRENQLYRVQIHRGGTAWDGQTEVAEETEETRSTATFVWSRDNGSVRFPIRSMNGTTVYLDHLGRDERLSVKEGDWVEIVDDEIAAQYEPGTPGRLAKVVSINLLDMTMVIQTPDGAALPSYSENGPGHPLLRRWDYLRRETGEVDIPSPANDGALLVVEDTWLTLENGVQIRFVPPDDEPHIYRTGDHWLIAARTETADVEWPKETDDKGEIVRDNNGNPKPMALNPHGVTHHYAPLAVIIEGAVNDVRNTFCPMQPCTDTNATIARRKRG